MVRLKSPVRLDWVDPTVCSLEYRLKIIGRLPFFKHLPAEAISKINGLFHDHEVSTDERIYFEGDEAEYLYLVAMGKVKLIRDTDSGREVLLDILRGGEYFGALMVFGVKQLSAYTVEQRIASALLRLAGKLGESHGKDVLIQLPFSRQDLAAMTGSTMETVSRVMSRFGEAGVVKSGRKWVTIIDAKRLEELGKRGAVN